MVIMNLYMSFGLTNDPVAFIDLMIKVFTENLYLFVIIFMDDILIYFRNEEEHASHLTIILRTLKECQLFAKFRKYEFWLQSVAFLGHIVSSERIRVDSKKIEVVKQIAQAYLCYRYQKFLRYSELLQKGSWKYFHP